MSFSVVAYLWRLARLMYQSQAAGVIIMVVPRLSSCVAWFCDMSFRVEMTSGILTTACTKLFVLFAPKDGLLCLASP